VEIRKGRGRDRTEAWRQRATEPRTGSDARNRQGTKAMSLAGIEAELVKMNSQLEAMHSQIQTDLAALEQDWTQRVVNVNVILIDRDMYSHKESGTVYSHVQSSLLTTQSRK
jgi:hypothetical protein